MMSLESIIQDGLQRMDDAVERVLDKWDHTPYGNGINDDADILQACQDDYNGLKLEAKTYFVSKALNLRDGDSIVGSCPKRTILSMIPGYKPNNI